MPIKTSHIGYITINSLPHYGEKAVPTGKTDGETAEFILLDCRHNETRVQLRREELLAK